MLVLGFLAPVFGGFGGESLLGSSGRAGKLKLNQIVKKDPEVVSGRSKVRNCACAKGCRNVRADRPPLTLPFPAGVQGTTQGRRKARWRTVSRKEPKVAKDRRLPKSEPPRSVTRGAGAAPTQCRGNGKKTGVNRRGQKVKSDHRWNQGNRQRSKGKVQPQWVPNV